MKVDFMIIGAMKSGTTSLAHYLSRHPEICFSKEKEPGFFSKYENWEKKINSYHALFNASPGQKLGEASTMYTMRMDYPNVSDRLYKYNPNLKLIYILRDPVQRIISHYAHRYVRKRIKSSPENEVTADSSYLDRSKYFYQISPYLDRFPRKNILFIIFEQFIEAPTRTMRNVSSFLGIDESFYNQIEFKAQNSSSNRKVIPVYTHVNQIEWLKAFGNKYLPSAVKRRLIDLFGNEIKQNPEFSKQLQSQLFEYLKEDIEQLETLLDVNLDHWRIYQ